MNNRLVVWILAQLMVFGMGMAVISNKPDREIVQPPIVQPEFNPIQVQPESPPPNPSISNPRPAYQNYIAVVQQLEQWNQEAPRLTEIGKYGKSSRGQDLWYIRVKGDNDIEKPKVMITACIHGNEPLSASTVMNYIGSMLERYGEDDEITEIINSRDIYFIPVVSPDSYPNSRHVDGVDPNRNFPTQRDPNKRSVAPVQALRDFFLKVKPDAIISGHTFGRVYLTPWGDNTQRCPNDSDYQRIIGEMSDLSRYRYIRACEMYNRPIYGTEVDWYYRNGAFSIVMEFGTHQRVPSRSDIDHEYDRTFKAVLHFMKEAPLVNVNGYWLYDWQLKAG